MSKLSNDGGYLMIDHRDSPGVGMEMMPVGSRLGDQPVIVGNSLFEGATSTCSHCQRVVLLNPGRVRKREVCKKCSHYICDPCAAEMARTLECIPFQKVLDDAQERAALAEHRGLIIT